MKLRSNEFAWLRKDINGIWHIFPGRKMVGGIMITTNNIDDVLADIFSKDELIYGYKTITGAKNKILSLIKNL